MRSTLLGMGSRLLLEALGAWLSQLLLFFSVLGAAVTVYSGVFASRTAVWGSNRWDSVGDAVDHGVAYGFLTAWPVALSVCWLRAQGVDIG
jgi:hypothetical protein